MLSYIQRGSIAGLYLALAFIFVTVPVALCTEYIAPLTNEGTAVIIGMAWLCFSICVVASVVWYWVDGSNKPPVHRIN